MVNKMPVPWQKEGGEGTGQIAETCNEQQDAQEAWDETGSNDKNPERKEPKSPEDLGNDKSLAVQTEEHVGQGLQLTRFKYR